MASRVLLIVGAILVIGVFCSCSKQNLQDWEKNSAQVKRYQRFDRKFDGLAMARFSNSGDKVFVSHEKGLSAIDAQTGEVVWDYEVRLPMPPELIVGKGGRVYIEPAPGELLLLDSQTGTLVKKLKLGKNEGMYQELVGAIEVDDGKALVVRSGSRTLAKVDLDSGERREVLGLREAGRIYGESKSNHLDILVATEKIVVFLADGRLASIDLDSRKVRLLDEKRKFKNRLYSKDLEANLCFVVSDAKELFCVKLESGSASLSLEETKFPNKGTRGAIFPEEKIIVRPGGTSKFGCFFINAQNSTEEKQIKWGTRLLVDLQASLKGKCFLTVSMNGEIAVWNTTPRAAGDN